MHPFTIHTVETAPEASRPVLKDVQAKLGFIPNAVGEMAESPALVRGWWDILSAARLGAFSPTEAQIVELEASRLNDCSYCLAAGTTFGEKAGVPRDVLEALRLDRPLAEPRFEALRQFTRMVMKKMGRVDDHDIKAFIDAGYSHAHVMEVVLHVSAKFITNYVNHIARTPLDQPFEANRIEDRLPRDKMRDAHAA